MEDRVYSSKDNNDNLEIKVPITVSKFDLREGDILDQNILYYDNLKPGISLTKGIINAIQNIKEVVNVRVLRSKKLIIEESTNSGAISEKDQTVQNISQMDLKFGFFSQEYDKKIAEAIKNTFDSIRGKDYQEATEKMTSKIYESIDTSNIGEGVKKVEFQKTIYKISSSIADVFSMSKVEPITSKSKIKALNMSNNSVTSNFLDLIILDKVSFINSARSIIASMINSFGDDNKGFVLSSMMMMVNESDYVVSHSLLITSISIVIAKELTKLTYEKISNKSNLDPSILKIVSMKTYGFDDMVSLGLAALMHDVGLRKHFGVFSCEFEFPKISMSKVELHSSESAYFAQKLNLDINIQRAIYEHHEYLDSTGYPKGTNKYLSRYSYILSFVERFVDLIIKSPFNSNPLPPPLAINYILKKEISRFDKDVIFAFIRATSSYPIGSWIALTNNKIGFVIGSSSIDTSKPIVKAVLDSTFKLLPEFELVDLSQDDVKVSRIISVLELMEKYPNFRDLYFD